MALIAQTKTKGDLKTKVGEPVGNWLIETSMFGPEIGPGKTVVCTNHPKRSWFAQVEIDADLRIRKVS